LHSLELDIIAVKLTELGSGKWFSPSSHFLYPDNEFLVIKTGQKLQADRTYAIDIAFKGVLTDSLAGLYRSRYTTSSGEVRWLATTQFEATDARRAFPCFDEPTFKATFDVTLIAENAMTALSNMPVKNVVDRGDGTKAVSFEPSVRMSTYLLAFIVSDFVAVETTTPTGTLVRVWTQAEKINQTNISLDAGARILAHFEEYFGVAFPLPKQDLVAIPDFAAGAMENWGLITFRETDLLFDPVEASASDLQRVVTVVAHELAHQWFGNLVTMQWWDQLWLNEGFANYMEYLGTDFVYPEWKMWDQFVPVTKQPALNLDSSVNSHPVLQPVNNPAEINEMFDSITYNKGASLIAMMVGFLGEKSFAAGAHNYLVKNSYGNAESDELWGALSAAAKANGDDIDVAKVMKFWTEQMGYPHLTINKAGASAISVSQNRFLLPPDDSVALNYQWDISLDVAVRGSGGNASTHAWLHRSANQNNRVDYKVDLPAPGNPQWFKADIGETGFYRVNYPADNWDALEQAMADGDELLTERDRSGLLDDAFALASANHIAFTQYLNLTRSLHSERAYVPWASAFSHLAELERRLRSVSDGPALFAAYMRNILNSTVEYVGWNDDGSHPERLLRASVLDRAAGVGLESVKDNALQMFAKFKADPVAGYIAPDLRSAVYGAAIANGDHSDWEFLFNQRYKTTKVAQEAKRCLRALSRSTNVTTLYTLLKYAIDPAQIRGQDTLTVISYVSQTAAGQSIAWYFVKDNWNELYARYHTSLKFSDIITAVTANFDSAEQANDFASFIKGKDLGAATRAAAQAQSTIQQNIRWKSKNAAAVVDWLRANA